MGDITKNHCCHIDCVACDDHEKGYICTLCKEYHYYENTTV